MVSDSAILGVGAERSTAQHHRFYPTLRRLPAADPVVRHPPSTKSIQFIDPVPSPRFPGTSECFESRIVIRGGRSISHLSLGDGWRGPRSPCLWGSDSTPADFRIAPTSRALRGVNRVTGGISATIVFICGSSVRLGDYTDNSRFGGENQREHYQFCSFLSS